MSTTDAITPRPALPAGGVGARHAFRALTVESARAWLAQPEPTRAGHRLPDPIVDYFEHGKSAVRALLHELDRLTPDSDPCDWCGRPATSAIGGRPACGQCTDTRPAQRFVNEAGIADARHALAAVRPPCPGTGTFIDQDTVDGAYITTCPVCRLYRPARHVQGRWWAVDGHRARHLAACLDEDGTLDACVCGLDEKIARIEAAITEAGHATEAVTQ